MNDKKNRLLIIIHLKDFKHLKSFGVPVAFASNKHNVIMNAKIVIIIVIVYANS